ncbi:MAG: MBL fold metallo-hydrolase [Opitutales bacterium]|nr:MBL fold metallo-hydrolase [Opitutales bacterium]
MTLSIKTLELPPIGTNCYLLTKEGSDEIAVVDAPLGAWKEVKAALEGLNVRIAHLLMTHGHWDHTLDGWLFNEDRRYITYGGDGDAEFYRDPESMSRFSIPGLEMKPMRIDRWVKQGDRLTLLGETVEVREVPGHSPGSVLFWFKESDCVFSGDALFQRSIGRTDFPGCSFEELERSIQQQIYSLPRKVKVYPGHGPRTAVGEEIENNPFVRAAK